MTTIQNLGATAIPAVTKETALAMEVLTNPRLERLYQTRTKSIKYIFANGHVANFIKGRYTTSDPDKIKELDKEVAGNHPEIFVDQNEREIDPRMEDPKLRMRAEIIKDLMSAQMIATDPERNLGEYSQGKLNPSSTSSIAPVAAGGNATLLSTQVNALLSPTK